MTRHGVWDPELVAHLELPSNMAIMSVDIAAVDEGAQEVASPDCR
jgi:hypothetical protein